MASVNARTILALARGVHLGSGCRCRVCGPSPFDASDARLGSGFTDYELLVDGDAPAICLGCASLLAGRPGDDPPPLRTISVRASVEGGTEVLDTRGLWSAITKPLDSPHVLSWAVGRQRAQTWRRPRVAAVAFGVTLPDPRRDERAPKDTV